MPYKKTKDGSLVNEVTLGDGYPLSNDLQPLKVGGEASPIEMSTSLPDGSDSAKVKVRGDLEVTGGLNFKNDVEVDLSFDDLSLSGDLDVAGSVGIGTTSPTEMLHLQGTGDVKILLEADTDNTTETDNPEILFSQDGGAVTGSIGFTNVNDLRITNAYNHDDGDIHLQTRSTTRMSVLGNGNVGIGTDSPTTSLHIKETMTNNADNSLMTIHGDVSDLGTEKVLIDFTMTDSNANNYPQVKIGAAVSQNSDANTQSKEGSGAFVVYTSAGTSTVDGEDNTAERMRVDYQGNVGIGTASPDVALEINGGAGADLDPLLRINKDVDGDGSATGILIGAVAAGQSKAGIFFENKGIGSGRGSLHFCSDNTSDTSDATIADARMTIIDGGNVGIGTTSPDSNLHISYSDNSPEGDLKNNFNNVGLQVENTHADGCASIQLRSNDADGYIFYDKTGSNAGDMHFRTDGMDSLSSLTLKDDGKVGVGTESPTTKLDVEGTVSYKHTAFTTAGPTDSIDVSDTTVLEVDTSSNNVTIGGFSGGVQGQVLYIVKTDTTNFIQLEHDETPAAGSHQKIFLTSGADERVVGYGGYTLYCNGTNWYSLSNPTGAEDAG